MLYIDMIWSKLVAEISIKKQLIQKLDHFWHRRRPVLLNPQQHQGKQHA
jgi:hypothetical protein